MFLIFFEGSFIWGLISCDSYEIPSTEAETGSISGALTLFDEGPTPLSSSAGAKISLEGTAPLIHTFSDQFGRFELRNVPFGTYVVVYEKEGFGAYKYLGGEEERFVHLSEVVNTKIPHINLSEKSTTQIQDFMIEKVLGGYHLIITAKPGGSPSRTGYFSFLYSDTNPNVSSINYNSRFTFYSNSNPSILFMPDDLYEGILNRQTGKAYMRVYGDNYLNNSYLENEKIILPNLNPFSSEVVVLEKK